MNNLMKFLFHLSMYFMTFQLCLYPLAETQSYGVAANYINSSEKPLALSFEQTSLALVNFVFPSAHAQGNSCTNSGRISYTYSAISVCLTNAQNTLVQNEINTCLAISSTIAKVQCLQGSEDRIYNIILDPTQTCNSTEKTTCESQPGMVFNCMANLCLTTAQNSTAITEANTCKNKPNVQEKKTCVTNLQAQLDAYYVANGTSPTGGTPGASPTPPVLVDPCLQSPAALACSAQAKMFACDVNLCLTSGEFLLYQSEQNKCTAQFAKLIERIACKDIVNKNIRDYAQGRYNSCDKSSNQAALDCQAAAQVWNCLGQVCLTPTANNNLNGQFETCRIMTDPVQKDLCSKNAVTTVAEYKVLECVPTSTQISTCQAMSKVHSCVANGCVTQKEDQLTKTKYEECQSQATPELQDACIKKYVDLMNEYNGTCTTALTADKSACEAIGKVWNCQANYCLSQSYNDLLRDQAVDCYLLSSDALTQTCINTLTDKTISDIASGSLCDMSVPKAISCNAKAGKTWNCNVNFCLDDTYNDSLTASTVACYKKTTQTERDACMTIVKRTTARDIASGSLCEKTSKEYQDCTAKGMVWNCNVNFCLSPTYNTTLTDKTVLCYDKPSEPEQNLCISELKQQTISDIASGALCDSTIPEAVSCSAEGKVWNCQINFCLPKDYNDALTTKAIACYTDKTTAQSETCLTTLKSNTITDIASGKLCDATLPEAVSCMAEGKVWNCNINFCLPKTYNDKLTASTVLCYEKPLQSEVDMCMEQVKSDTISDLAGGALCEKNTPQALDCANVGNIWNCLINYCLTPTYNASLTDNIISCYKKPTPTERDQCITNLKDKTVGDIAGGALCDKTTSEASQCEAKPGFVYNCEVKFCLPKDYNDMLAQNAKICFGKTTEAEKQLCMTDLKKMTALEIASGKLCDATVPEAVTCAAEGKIWNCNVNFCLDKKYNDNLSQNAAMCYEKPVQSEIDKCMSDLKLTIVADIAGGGQCDQTVKEAIDCKAENKIWNCSVDLCVDTAFNKKIVDGSVDCYKLVDKVLIDKCMIDLKSILVAEVAGGALCDPNTPEALACNEEGKVYNCQIKMCLTKEYNDALTKKVVVCYQKPTKAETETCIASLKSDTVRDIASGALCDMSLPEAKTCKESGKIWNCNVNFCLSKEYNDKLTNKSVLCYEKTTEAEVNSCMAEVKDDTVADIASGALCDMNSQEAKDCTSAGNVFNCNINYCVSAEYNAKLTDKVVACYKEPNKETTDICMSKIKNDTIADLAGGAACNKNTPEAIACGAKEGKVFNCEINYCVTQEYNQKLVDGTKGCLAQTTTELQQKCLAELKDSTVKEIASGALCENTSEESKKCEADGMVFNCNVNFCLTNEYNNALAGKAAICYDKPSKSEVSTCMKKLEHDTAVDIAGGALCKNDSPEAKSCEASGKVYNCTVSYCLTKEQNGELAEEVAKCQTMSDESAKAQCMTELEAKATEFVVSGGLCDKNTPEAKSCEAKGKVFNCNMDLCISSAENEVLTEEALRCQAMPTDQEKDSCINELKQVGAAYLATNCDTEGNSEANQCKASGKVWNCHANKCLTDKENEMLTRAILRCEGKTSSEDKAACYEEMKEFEKMAADEGGAVNIKDLQYNQKSSMGTAQALTIAIGSIIAAAVAGCISAALFGIAVTMTPNLEEQIKDEAKTKMAQLQEEYAVLEAKKGKEGVSYEIQVEAFTFYLKALNTAASIADKAGGNMSTLMGLFGAAMAIGAVDIAIGMSSCPACNWPQITCGGIIIGLAGKGMNATSKYKSIAENMAKEYRNRAKVIQNILDRFKKLFGPDGGLDDIIAQADDLKGRVDAKSSAKATTASNSSGDSFVSNAGGSSSSTNTSNNSSGSNKGTFANTSGGSLNSNSSDPAGGERTCLDGKGKVDKSCNCQKTSSCKQFKMPLLSAEANKVKSDLDIDGMLKEVNDIASGKITTSHLDRSVLNKRNTKIRSIANQLVKNANKLLVKNGKKPIDVSDAALVNFINARVTKKDLLKGSAAFSSGYFGVSEDKLNSKDGIIKKSINKSNSLPQIKNLRPLTSMRIMPRGITEGMFDQSPEVEPVLAANSQLSNEMGYDYDNSNSQVISKPEVSIFRIISNRYLKVRRDKRIGRTKK